MNLHRKRLVPLHHSLAGAWRLAQSIHFSFTHRVVGAVVIEDHGPLVGPLIGLVASASACEAFEGACLDGLIGWSG